MDKPFTEEEQRQISPFFTNLHAPVFGLNLPHEVAGALFSRYSRSTHTLRRTFLDEFLKNAGALLPPPVTTGHSDNASLQKARAFYDRVLVGYGDDSIAQLGGAHIACEDVSNVAAKLLEDARIGIAPLEKSTRYVYFDQKNAQGEYPFYREPKILTSPHRNAYLKTMDLLFETYSQQIGPVTEFIKKSLPIGTIEFKHPRTGAPLRYQDTADDLEMKKWADSAYKATVRAHVCDLLRGYLPAATLTHVGIFGTGQAYEHLLTKLYSNPLTEAGEIARAAHESLNQMIPSFVKRANPSRYLSETFSSIRALAGGMSVGLSLASDPVTLVDYDPNAEERIVAAILYSHTREPLMALRHRVQKMSSTERGEILDAYITRRKNRRDKPGRALEQVYYTFDLIGNLGLYRDLHRHRILSQERQDFTTAHGYDRPPEMEEMGLHRIFDTCMERAAALYEKVYRDLPLEAQYVVPFAYRIRWYMKMNLREAVHIGELRTMAQGHADYRLLVQQMWRKIEEVHPALSCVAKFIDWKSYRLGRLSSEMRSEYKRSQMES